MTRSLHTFKERHDLELASLRRHKDEGSARFQVALLRAKSKRAKYKTDCTKAQTTVRHLHAALAAVSVERDQLRDDLAELEAEYDRSRSLLSDRDDRVGLLQATISGLELERDQALRDCDVLRTSIAALVTGPSLPFSSRPVETAPSTSASVKRPSTSALAPPPQTKRARIEATSQSVVKVTPDTHSPTASGIVAEPSPPCKSPKNNPSRSPHSSTRSQTKLTPKTPVLPRPGVRKGKGRARNLTPAPASSDDDNSSDAGPRTLAALSRSRSSSWRKVPLGNPTTPFSTLPELIVVDTSSPDVDSPTSLVAASLRPKPKVSKADLFGEASSSSEGPISVTEDVRAPANNRLSLTEYKDLSKSKVPRDQWIPGYHCRVPKSSVQV
uniref:Shugoshin C-terminal domain-containing protein n=1 Tax=Peronospora matthiolae TaxID=2874970 RepID=A0AAV1V1D7_9STRA